MRYPDPDINLCNYKEKNMLEEVMKKRL